jgi:hypothetical protein
MNQSLSQPAVGFSWKQPLSLAFEKTQGRFWFVLGVLVVAFLVQMVPEITASFLRVPEEGGIRFFFNLIGSILSVFMSAGILRVMLRVVRGEATQIKDLFADPKLVPHYFVASLLYGLIVLAGFLLLIVPGIVWSIKYGMFGYFLVERKAGIMDSFRQSAALTEGAKWQLLWLGLATAGITLLGILAFFVGIFFALPLVSLAHAYAYVLLGKSATEAATVLDVAPQMDPVVSEVVTATEESLVPEQPKAN